jgi:hypothetical protein
MSTESLPNGPDADALIRLIRETWPDAVVAPIDGHRVTIEGRLRAG